jgi:deoxycytidine triphosphate deaminase
MELVTYDDFDKNSNGEQDVIHPFEIEHLQPLGIDLTLGQDCYNLTTGKGEKLGKDDVFPVRHGDFVVVWTEETLHVRDDWFGLVCSKVSLIGQGLTHFGTKVDPGFEGKLQLSFRNDGHRVIKLKRGQPICNVIFLRLPKATGATYKRELPRPTTLEVPLSFRYRLREEDVAKLGEQHSREFVDFYHAF